MTARTFLVHGLLAGLLAGVAAFLVAYVVGEPPVDAAIAVEEAAAHSDGHEHTHDHAAAVSRTAQSTWGLATGTLVLGGVLGGLTGLVAAVAAGRLGPLRPAAGTALVAGLGFVAFALVPWLRYPANPPAVGDPGTIDDRTLAYFGLVTASLLLAAAATVVAVRLLPRLGGYRSVVVGVAAYAVPVGILAAVLPAASGVGDFPAQTLWEFRVASLLTLVTLWGVLGIALTGLVDLTWRRHRADVTRRERAASL